MRQAVIETVMSNLRDGWRRNVDETLWQHVLYLPTEMSQPVGQHPVISQMILFRTERETTIPDSKTFTISGGLALSGRYPGGGKSSQCRDLDWLCWAGAGGGKSSRNAEPPIGWPVPHTVPHHILPAAPSPRACWRFHI